MLYIYFSSPRTKELLQNWVKFFSFAAVECSYILLTTIENLIYLSTFDSGTVSFYTPSHKKTPQLPTALARKKYKTKVMFDYTKKQRCFCCCYLCSGWHSLFRLWSFNFLHSKINQNIIIVLQIHPCLERIKFQERIKKSAKKNLF